MRTDVSLLHWITNGGDKDETVLEQGFPSHSEKLIFTKCSENSTGAFTHSRNYGATQVLRNFLAYNLNIDDKSYVEETVISIVTQSASVMILVSCIDAYESFQVTHSTSALI